MKIYIHEGEGFYIGSVIIVYAGTLKTAKKLIRKELDLQGLQEEEISIENIINLEGPREIYSFNGDY